MSKLQTKLLAGVMIALSAVAWASPVSPSARRVIPSAFEQIICIDYRAIQQSQSALALKAEVFPKKLGDFEAALKVVGVDTQRDLESLTFASFRDQNRELKTIALASGSFSPSAIAKKVGQNSPPMSYRGSDLYLMVKAADPKAKDLEMTFLDARTLLFGDHDALEIALNVLNGDSPYVDFNRKYVDLMRSIDKAPVWSVLDRQGSLVMLRSALGNVSKEEQYADVRKSVLGADYVMNFDDQVKIDLSLLTVDPETSSNLSALLRLGELFQRVSATPAAKVARKSKFVDFDALGLEIHFRADQTQMQSLLQAHFFDVLCSNPNSSLCSSSALDRLGWSASRRPDAP